MVATHEDRRRIVNKPIPPLGKTILFSWGPSSLTVALLCASVQRADADSSKEATWAISAGGNGHTYRVVAAPNVISWDSAYAQATFAGGYLATITSAAENGFVFSLIDDPAYWTQSSNGHGPWIGGYQPLASPEPGGGWTWVTQTGALSPEPFAYTNWESGEPNNLTAVVGGITYNQDRISFLHLGTGRAATWSDEYDLTGSPLNQWTRSYVIEFNGVPTALRNSMILSNGWFQLGFTNYSSASFVVMMTTNLALPLNNWTSLGSVTQASPGHFQFTDSAAPGNPRRFYCVRAL